LVEIAFLSNREDEKRIMDPDFHKQVAQKIAAGVANWYKYNRRQPLEED
jgi:N-acetylmuramoyl-L-alanine amidase